MVGYFILAFDEGRFASQPGGQFLAIGRHCLALLELVGDFADLSDARISFN